MSFVEVNGLKSIFNLLIMEKNKQENIPTESEEKDGVVIETTKPLKEKATDEKGFTIKRGKVDSLSIYEVSENELSIIEKGSSNSIYLNFSIFLLSTAASFLIALLTGDYTNKLLTYITFICLTVIGFVIGGFLLILWLKKKDDFAQVIERVKDRMKE